MMEEMISRLKNHFDINDDTVSAKCEHIENANAYGIPAERRVFTRSWVSKHSELFHKYTDSELIAETNAIQTNLESADQKQPDSQIEKSDDIVMSSYKTLTCGVIEKGMDHVNLNKKKLKSTSTKLGETDSGLPATVEITNASVNKCTEGPQCESCQSLLNSLCRGCHYKVQTETDCYFFSTFKKNKSKKTPNKVLPIENLCNKCKSIVQDKHESSNCKSSQSVPPDLPKSSKNCKSVHSINDLPNWSRQRKYMLHNRKRSLCKKPDKNCQKRMSKLDRNDRREKILQSRSRKPRNRYTSCLYKSNNDLTFDKDFGDTLLHCKPSLFRKLKSNNWKRKKSLKSCVKTCNAGTQSRVAGVTGNKKRTKHTNTVEVTMENPPISPDTPFEKCSSKKTAEVPPKRPGRLSRLKKICPCDAACEFCEDLKLNWRLLTTLPKNWGNFFHHGKGEKCYDINM
ncbi:hypothetical protein WDU94_001525 [Cyamophila willieti]